LKERVEKVIYQEKKAYVMGRMSAGMWEHAIMEKMLELKMKYWGRYLEIVG